MSLNVNWELGVYILSWLIKSLEFLAYKKTNFFLRNTLPIIIYLI